MIYVTSAGDMWDSIAFKTLGSCEHVEALINANRQFITTFIFPAGVSLTLPTVDKKSKKKLPPWKR